MRRSRSRAGPGHPTACRAATAPSFIPRSTGTRSTPSWTPVTDPELEGYSGFEETDLAEVLRSHDVDEVTVVGLATDYCVRHTALDALREGFRVTIDRGGIRGIDVKEGDSERALDELRSAGAAVT